MELIIVLHRVSVRIKLGNPPKEFSKQSIFSSYQLLLSFHYISYISKSFLLRGEKKIGQVRGEAERATGNEGKLNEERVRNGDVALNRMRNNN